MNNSARLFTPAAVVSVLVLIVIPLGVALLSFGQQLGAVTAAELLRFSNAPGLVPATVYSLALAIVAPLLACYMALAFSARTSHKMSVWLSPLLSIPHLAFAVGIVFLFSPSGWLVRALHSVSGAFAVPPEVALLPERSFTTLLVVLILKEVPFLLLMIYSACAQLPIARYRQVGCSLGYSATASWWQLIVPELLRRLTLPMAAVMVYTVSVVDIPLLIGPNLPGVLAQEVLAWQRDFAPYAGVNALLGSALLLGITLCLLGLNRLHQPLYAWALTWVWRSGRAMPKVLHVLGGTAMHVARLWLPMMVVLSIGVLVSLAVWSLASGWFYPRVLPSAINADLWQREWLYVQPMIWTTLKLAAASATIALVAALACLEAQHTSRRRWPQWPMLLALLAPQLPLVMAWQYGASMFQLAPHLGWVFWAHCVFAFPYAYLVVAGDYQRYDRRWLLVGQSLGYSPLGCWLRLLLPMLRRPILYGWVIAFSVSVAQYVPTQLLGAGRVVTLTTEAVNVSSGGDRQLLSFYALWQFILPLAALLAVALYLALVTRRQNA
ncbi:hypothetical protein KO507_03285 [Gilvimarinus agarilyticus]|uniref:hypothetical protein n=1 Tax=Gilvimarinus sp. 2_MG-2023 TaxID=3062666 RepID=UPI001C08E1F7|nr:hypothetical protein [Gilvimarinus sp. 2_MG-2023]MBU2884785.1 hypothetical protein [Gilvimarinus agarilyticus]MDO6569835.1 hypothetical protein [Gilvimarinus sp. 2_MG-2023]